MNFFIAMSFLATLASARLSSHRRPAFIEMWPFGSDESDAASTKKPATQTYDAPVEAGSYDEPGSTVTSDSSPSNSSACFDTDNGALDAYGVGCSAYTEKPDFCMSAGDDGDFKCYEMCCACGGGSNKPYSKPGDCKKLKDGKEWCKNDDGWWVPKEQLRRVKVAVDDVSGDQPAGGGCFDKGKDGIWCPKSDGIWYRKRADGTLEAATPAPDGISTTPEPVTTSMTAEGPPVKPPASNHLGPPWATLGSIPDACVPEPKVPDNYPCIFSAQCENGYCSPHQKLCMADSGSSPVPKEVIEQESHTLFRSIVWDSSRSCYTTGCQVCSAEISDSSSIEYKACFEAGSMFGGDSLDLEHFNPANPACKCDPRFVQAWFTESWVGCASR